MIWFSMHIGDWMAKTAGLTAAQEGYYLRLVTWYYANERQLPPSLEDVMRIARANTGKEREAVMRLLDAFFFLAEDGWHNKRCDQELKTHEKKTQKFTEKKLMANTRQQRSRDRRRVMFQALVDAGKTPDFSSSTSELMDQLEEHGIKCPVTRDTENVTRNVTRDKVRDRHVSQPHRDIELGVPNPISLGKTLSDAEIRQTLDSMQAACAAMKAGGLADVRQGHPDLLLLLQAGVQPQDLALAAAEASARGKGFAYALAIAKSRHESPPRPLDRSRINDLSGWATLATPEARERLVGRLNASDPSAPGDPPDPSPKLLQ